MQEGPTPSPRDAGERRFYELGIAEAAKADTGKNALLILKRELINSGETLKPIKAKSKFSSKIGFSIFKTKKKKAEEIKNTAQKIQNSINYLEVFCFYFAQKGESKNIFAKESASIDSGIHETIDLLEVINAQHKQGQKLDKDSVQKVSELVIQIFELYPEGEEELKMVASPVFQSLIQLSKATD